MGNSRTYRGPSAATRGPGSCISCKKGIVYGDRCPPCERLMRIKAAKRRRKR